MYDMGKRHIQMAEPPNSRWALEIQRLFRKSNAVVGLGTLFSVPERVVEFVEVARNVVAKIGCIARLQRDGERITGAPDAALDLARLLRSPFILGYRLPIRLPCQFGDNQ